MDLAGEFLAIGHPEAALPITQHLLQIGYKNAQVYYDDGAAQAQSGNLAAATTDFENASDLEPTNVAVLAQLADLYMRQNRGADAERVALRAVKFHANDPQAYVILGTVYGSEQKWDLARQQYEEAYKLDPKDVSPLLEEATTWVDQNTIPKALQVVDRAVAADPTNVQVLVFRADLYAKQGNYAKAASAYDDAAAAATSDEERAAVMVRKAGMYAAANEQPQAEGVFEAAIKQYPAISSLRTAYGEYWIAQHQPQRAQQQFLAAIAIDHTDVSALLDMARLKISQNQITDAIGYLKQLTNVAPSAQSFALLGEAYVSAHDYGNARKACSQSFSYQRVPDTLGCIAGADYNLHNYKEAAQIFDLLNSRVKPFMDGNPQLLYMAAASYAHLNQKQKAVSAYRQLLSKIRPGTPAYKNIQKQIAQLSRRPPPKKVKKH